MNRSTRLWSAGANEDTHPFDLENQETRIGNLTAGELRIRPIGADSAWPYAGAAGIHRPVGRLK